MTENIEDKPKKLTFNSSAKLTLNKRISPTLQKTFIGSKSNTVVEVKKSQAAASNNSLHLSKLMNVDSKEQENNSEEFNKRLNLLKKAAEENREKDQSKTTSTLSKLAAANQITPKQQEIFDDNQSENIEKSGLLTEQDQEKAIEVTKPKIAESKIDVTSNFVDEEENTNKKLLDPKAAAVKVKNEEPKKLKKADIWGMLGEAENDLPSRMRSQAAIKRAREKEKRKLDQQKQSKVYREVIIPETINIAELANRMTERVADVMRELKKLGISAENNEFIDADTAEIIVTSFGHTAKRIQESDIENVLNSNDDENDIESRAPIVTVMGHVDHGKTSLLDALKSTDVVSTEAGGITQHIGAYQVNLANGKAITFIDTPGHEAFTEMRTRGAKVTDIVVLVVAADDGIKMQTIEAINHAKAANVPIIVAINKIDKPDINLDKVKNELLIHDLVAEELGGDIMIVPISALKRINLDKLEEAILLIAEMQDLKANPKANAAGVVIEAKIDKNKGVISTIIVKKGTLRSGDLIVAGTSYGRIKRMINYKGQSINLAGPSMPVEIFGLNEAPLGGDNFDIVKNEKQARDITEYRKRLIKEKNVNDNKVDLESMFAAPVSNIKVKELPMIIKGDVQGSIEAIIGSLNKLPHDEVKIKILHQAVGGITESDVSLAKATGAIVIGFNVRANNNTSIGNDKDKVDIRYYSIIYNLIDDIKILFSGMLSPILREQYIGSVDIREIFNITKIGKIAGSYVTKGIIKRGAGVRLIRNDIVIYEGKLKTLKRFKDEVKEVRENFECGIAFENFEDIKIGDKVEVFETIEEKKQL